MKKNVIFMGIIALTGMHNMHAQDASEYKNNAPINGINCSGFGALSLQNNAPTDANNTALGYSALFNNNGGQNNTAAGTNALFNNTSGIDNTAGGHLALFNNSTGNYNTAFGKAALYFNTADGNSAFGDSALYSNTSGTDNTAFGNSALHNNIANANTAFGSQALFSNTTGNNNVAIGTEALYTNVGSANTAIGAGALIQNTTGGNNVAVGTNAMQNTSIAFDNTAIGSEALLSNNTGNHSTAVGYRANFNSLTGSNNTSIGYLALATSTNNFNTGVGSLADVSAANLSNATALGNGAITNASNKIRFGNAAVTVVEGPVAYTISDGRFKTNVKTDDVKGLEFIKKLRPVVYNFDTKKFADFLTKNMPDSVKKNYTNKDFKASTAIRQSGFIAQEVEQAAKDAGYDFNGVHAPNDANDNYSLAYSQFVVPLVKAVQEQQTMIDAQNTTIDALKTQLANLSQQAAGNPSAANNGLSAGSGNQQLAGLSGFSMDQNVPNPFTHETVINYTLPSQINSAYMAVYDLTGKQITTFPITQKGASSLTITSEKLSPGIYIYSIVGDGSVLDSKRMIVADK